MPGTRVRTVLRQLTPPQHIGSEIKISRVKLSRSWVESPPPPPPSTSIQGPDTEEGGTGHLGQELRLEGKATEAVPATTSLLTSSSVFCFLATIPVLRASLFPPLRLPTWVKGQKTATVTGAGARPWRR